MSASENDQTSSDKEKDHAWVWGKKIEGERYIRCAFCNQQSSGGITRLKKHLSGSHCGIKPCSKVSKEAKEFCTNALKSFKITKMKQTQLLREVGEGCGGSGSSEGNASLDDSMDDSCYVIGGSRPKGPMDKHVTSNTQQSSLNSAFKKQQRRAVCRKVGRFFYNNAISFNAATSPYFMSVVDAIADFGKGFKPPSMYELRTWILKEEVNDMNMILKEHRQHWQNYGCTIMSDGWSDGNGRTLINFLVNSPAGCFFLRSIDASELIKDGATMFKCLDQIVEEVGTTTRQLINISLALMSLQLVNRCLGK